MYVALLRMLHRVKPCYNRDIRLHGIISWDKGGLLHAFGIQSKVHFTWNALKTAASFPTRPLSYNVQCMLSHLVDTYTDLDECLFLNGGCQQNCSNLNGTFECSCYDGFTLDTVTNSCTGTCACSLPWAKSCRWPLRDLPFIDHDITCADCFSIREL